MPEIDSSHSITCACYVGQCSSLVRIPSDALNAHVLDPEPKRAAPTVPTALDSNRLIPYC